MVNHRRRQHFLGQRQELLGEVPRQHERILDQVGHLLEQRLPDQRRRHASASPPGFHVQLTGDAAVTLAALEHDEVLGQALAIVVEALHLDGPSGAPARGQEPVPVGDGARSHVLHQSALRVGGAQNRERARRGPRTGTRSSGSGARTASSPLPSSSKRVPAHLLGERQGAQRRRQDVRQHVHGRLAALLPPDGEIGALLLRHLEALQGRDLDALLAREAFRRRRGPAVGVERGADRRARWSLPRGPPGAPTPAQSARVRRRGVEKVSTGASALSRDALRLASSVAPNADVSAGSQLAGSSSVPISISSSRSTDPSTRLSIVTGRLTVTGRDPRRASAAAHSSA